jgi:Zn-dependent M28 family amino/carboxypeptidase
MPLVRGANLVATIPGDTDRYVLVAAHYDHLGGDHRRFYAGADDNAAAVAILVEVARGLAQNRADGRGVIIAAFDAEEPPYFLSGQMGSQHWAKHAREIDKVDFMVCMDLVGHALGPDGLPDSVRGSLFALGAERSSGTAQHVDAVKEAGLFVRRADAEIIPPLSDYDAFWKREIPFLFLTCGRSARYHTPEDTPEHLDWRKMERTAGWLEGFVRRTCARDDRITFSGNRDDRSTLDSYVDLVAPLAAISPLAESAEKRARELLAHCDTRGALPRALADEPSALVLGLESALA